MYTASQAYPIKLNPNLHAFSYHSVSGDTQDNPENIALKMANPTPIYPTATN